MEISAELTMPYKTVPRKGKLLSRVTKILLRNWMNERAVVNWSLCSRIGTGNRTYWMGYVRTQEHEEYDVYQPTSREGDGDESSE